MIVLDTHALLWWTHDRTRLSPAALERLVALTEDRRGVVCSASFWEIALKVHSRKLKLGIGVDEYVRRLRQDASLDLVPIDAELWVDSVALGWRHRDPTDRLLVALAERRDLPLLTKDAAIHDFTGRAVW